MKGLRWSKLAAYAVFFVIALGLVCGMMWATVSNFELAKKTVTEAHHRKITRAVLDMSSYMAGILNSESSRPYWHYWAVHRREPLAAYTRVGAEVDAEFVDLASPLATAPPPNKWTDLYFQLSPDGVLTSPHFADDSRLLAIQSEHCVGFPDEKTRRVWEWLATSLPTIDLHDCIARAGRGMDPGGTATGLPASVGSATGDVNGYNTGAPTVVRAASAGTAGGSTAPGSVPSPLGRRGQILRESQVGYLPRPECEDPRITSRSGFGSGMMDLDAATRAPSGKVETSVDPIKTFWLGEGPSGTQKLAFVREGHSDAALFYQGFVADWSRLQPKLLSTIEDRFPVARLVPVAIGDQITPDQQIAMMSNLPVRLDVPGFSGGVGATAWRRVRGTLITVWAAALAALAVAGLGLRNLVALTERRMQFAYAVTHELRTPLTTFRLYADMLSAGLVRDDARQEYMDTLNRESVRLSSLVEGVLEYARLENQKVRLNPSRVEAGTILRTIAADLEKQCHDNSLVAKAKSNLSGTLQIHTDVDVVTRIAGVLVNNACRHARGSDQATVLFELGAENGTVHLDVADSGPGVLRRDAKAIFKPFRRGKGADAAARGGIGLGLALARNWARLLGGRLELAQRHHPQLGGAHFRLTIPS